MNDKLGYFSSPENAYFAFFEADKAKDAEAWAGVMSYPHVRVAASGSIERYDTLQDYAVAQDWTAREATGWAYTEGNPPVRLHVSQDKVHLLGGWTRYNTQDEPILWNWVTYVLTQKADSWGVQARFAVGSHTAPRLEAAVAEATGEIAVGVVRKFFAKVEQGGEASAIELCRSSAVLIDAGDVVENLDADRIIQFLGAPWKQPFAMNVNAVQCGLLGAVVEVAIESGGQTELFIVVVGKRDDVWTIGGISRISANIGSSV